MHVTAIIAAGGRGTRFGGAAPKQLLPVGGTPILQRSVEAFLSHPSVDEVVVALPDELVSQPPLYLRHATKPLKIVAGGARRQDSVANAFRAASGKSDVIVVHDAARPFVSADLIARTIAAAVESGAAVAALQARDTVKLAGPVKLVGPPEGGHHVRPGPPDGGPHVRMSGGAPRIPAVESAFPAGLRVDGAGRRTVDRTLDRETIYLAQTPQAFRSHVLADALASSDEATDEAALAERAGHPVRIVDGDSRNIKITTPDDMVLAEAIASSSTAPWASSFRVGTGYDLHRLVEGRPLILGGVTIPFDRGPLGHSDADAVCHAVTDAVLGAAAAGDIGRHFPDTDPQWKDASSVALLARAVQAVRERGFDVANVDATVIVERPKLAPHLDAMRATVAGALGVPIERVSIKGKTNEGIGELGRGEAIAVHAIAMLHKP